MSESAILVLLITSFIFALFCSKQDNNRKNTLIIICLGILALICGDAFFQKRR